MRGGDPAVGTLAHMPRLRLAEVLGSLSVATDMATANPVETGLGATVIATRLAERASVPADDLPATYYACLTRMLGCTVTAMETAAASLGEDRLLNHALLTCDWADTTEVARRLREVMPSDIPGPTRDAAIQQIVENYDSVGEGAAIADRGEPDDVGEEHRDDPTFYHGEGLRSRSSLCDGVVPPGPALAERLSNASADPTRRSRPACATERTPTRGCPSARAAPAGCERHRCRITDARELEREERPKVKKILGQLIDRLKVESRALIRPVFRVPAISQALIRRGICLREARAYAII